MSALSYKKVKAVFSPDSSPPPRPARRLRLPDVFSCPCRELSLHHVEELEQVGTMALQKVTSHVLFPWSNPSIHCDVTWDLRVSRESWGEMGPEYDFNPFLKHRETPRGIGQYVVLFSSYSQTPFKASAKKACGWLLHRSGQAGGHISHLQLHSLPKAGTSRSET